MLSTFEILSSALALPTEDRLALMDAIHVSLADPAIDHGPTEPADEVAAAWKEEIARRLEEVRQGTARSIPALEAERMIRGDVPITF